MEGPTTSSAADDVLEATVAELLDTFREALLGLVPSADRAKLRWDGMGTHHSWERLSMEVYDTFVSQPLYADRTAEPSDARLGRYDIDVDSYASLSWISVAQPETNKDAALVRLTTINSPFDSIEAIEVDPQTGRTGERLVLDWPDKPSMMRRRLDGTLIRQFSISAVD